MIVAIASGKGGTGKTLISVNLARVAGTKMQLLDCDVEEPNDHLFLGGEFVSSEAVSIPVPEVDESLCDACGACARFCAFNAIASLGTKPLVFPELCHGCGGCARVCPRGAIREASRRIGVIETTKAGAVTLVQGRLDVGVAMAPPLIRALKSRLRRDSPAILDSPPGASCPAVAAIRAADIVALVTEPTPFGLHDLRIAVKMTRRVGVPFGVIVNRVGSGDDRVHEYCRDEAIPIFLEVPDDRRIAVACSRGALLIDALPEYRPLFLDLLRSLTDTFACREAV